MPVLLATAVLSDPGSSSRALHATPGAVIFRNCIRATSPPARAQARRVVVEGAEDLVLRRLLRALSCQHLALRGTVPIAEA